MSQKRVYTFGNGLAEGKADMRNLLGGKGANLAEMNLIGVPVPPGFTITTDVCNEYYEVGKDKVVELLKEDVLKAVENIENLMNSKFGDVENPLLVSVRSGARASMPGMMDTILNLGLNDEVVEGMIRKTGNARFAWDSYRRFVQMYGDVVLGMKPVNKEDIDPFEAIIEEVKEAKGVKLDNELEVEDLKELVKKFKAAVKEQTGKDFPNDSYEQLWGAICAVFDSWMNDRAILYRKMEGIPAEWGTAVNVQAMVFGNMGDTSATGVCFSRDAGNGENLFNGEYLINAQGEDVVAGIRTPQQITKIGSQRWAERAGISEEERVAKYPSMEEAMPEIYKELDMLQNKLENHYRDMQDMEFTVQEGKLWFLQTRNGKRTGSAMVKIAMDLLREGLIDEKTALQRCEPNKLDELLHPVFDKAALASAKVLTRGLPASPGAATGQIVFFADDAAAWAEDGKKVVMVRIETSPEDLAGMAVAEGILTARGGMTSHAAVVARGMGKCCVSGAGALNIDYKARTVEIEGVVLKEGDYISINGTTGEIYAGQVQT
ncbi:MAG: pyruvate, phosphate dikinase, partial [Bacteroidaceae bacterium]|nr:pyruvate, phosphate dikinase [Bacteroidaceae bacterium]